MPENTNNGGDVRTAMQSPKGVIYVNLHRWGCYFCLHSSCTRHSLYIGDAKILFIKVMASYIIIYKIKIHPERLYCKIFVEYEET
jgi:hypothetical protein